MCRHSDTLSSYNIGVNMLDHLCLLNGEEGFLGSKTNSRLSVLLSLRGRRLIGEGKRIPGAREPRRLQSALQLKSKLSMACRPCFLLRRVLFRIEVRVKRE